MSMFTGAQNFTINNSKFIVNSASPSSKKEDARVTYENIKLFTPSAPIVFTGRDHLVTEAINKFTQNPNLHLAILGAGGIGKTALALHIMKNPSVQKYFKDKIYFMPCEIFTETSGFIQGLIFTLGLTVTEGTSGYQTLEHYMEALQHPLLLVVDNFETLWHNNVEDHQMIHNLVDRLMDFKKISILLTMRAATGPGSRKWYKLGGQSGLPTLAIDAAIEAFISISETPGDNAEQLTWLLKELDFMPLAIQLLAQLRKHLSLDTLIKQWKQTKTVFLEYGPQETRLTSVAVSVNLSVLSLERLAQSMDLGDLLATLSFLPSGIPFWQENIQEFVPGQNMHSVLVIISLALVYEENEGLRMLSPIREHLQLKYPVRTLHLNQMGEYYLNMIMESRGQDQKILEVHMANIAKIFEVQLCKEPHRSYLSALKVLLKHNKFWPITTHLIDAALMQQWDKTFEEEIELRFQKQEAMRWQGAYERAVSEIKTIQSILVKEQIFQRPINKFQKVKTSAQCLQCLGGISSMQDKYDDAKNLLAEAKTQFESIGDLLGSAQCLQSLGNIHRMQNEYDDAKRLLTEAKSQFESIGDQLGSAQCLHSLGNISRIQDEYDIAKHLLTEAKSQFESIGEQLGSAQCLQSLGDVFRIQNKYDDAKHYLTEARTQFELFGDQLGSAQCLQRLGDIFIMQNGYDVAKHLLTEAKSKFELFGSQLGFAQCIQRLGDICMMQNKYDEAKNLLTEAKSQFESIGFQLGSAQCLRSLGDISKMQDEYDDAKHFLTEAKSQFESIGDHLGSAQCLKRLGDIFIVHNEYDYAKHLLTEARTQFESIGFQLGSAQCLHSLGNISRMQDEYVNAKDLLTEARAQFGSIGDQLGSSHCLQSLGDTCMMQNEYDKARNLLTEARSQFDLIGFQLGSAQCLQSLGDILMMQNKYDDAKHLLTEAKTQFDSIGSQLGSAQCLQSLGNISRRQFKYDEAKHLLTEAKTQFDSIGSQLGSAQCLQSLENISSRDVHESRP